MQRTSTPRTRRSISNALGADHSAQPPLDTTTQAANGGTTRGIANCTTNDTNARLNRLEESGTTSTANSITLNDLLSIVKAVGQVEMQELTVVTADSFRNRGRLALLNIVEASIRDSMLYWEHRFAHASHRRWGKELRLQFRKRFEELTSPERVSALKFRNCFRMSRGHMQRLIEVIKMVMTETELMNYKKVSVSIEQRVHILVWRLAHGQSYRGMSLVFALSAGFINSICSQLLVVLSQRLPSILIAPELRRNNHTLASMMSSRDRHRYEDGSPASREQKGAEDSSERQDEFRRTDFINGVWGNHPLPGAVMAIDGSHFGFYPSKDPRIRDDFINRKGFPSLNVLVVVNSDEKFCYVDASCPGGMHDSMVLRQSELFDMLKDVAGDGRRFLSLK